MTMFQVAVDYSRPMQPMLERPSRIGTVHSVFRRAVNIALDDTLLTLLSDELPCMPNGVRAPHGLLMELAQRLRPGMEVWVGDGGLKIPGCDFLLCLPEELPWEPRPELEGYAWDRETVAGHVRLVAGYMAAPPGRPQGSHCYASGGCIALASRTRDGLVRWERFWELLDNSQKSWSFGETLLERMALPGLRLLARASWLQDVEGVEEATRGLAGLGPGLTPAGDDVLAGFAAVMVLLSEWISADGKGRGYVGEVIARVARARTTLLSGVLLEYAARGEVAEQVGTFLRALALPASEREGVLRAVDGLLAFGATSGGDTLLGVLLGLRTLEGE